MARRRRARGYPALAAFVLFVGLVAFPWIHSTNGTPPWVAAATGASPVPIPATPPQLPPVSLTAGARPIRPGGPIAKPPNGDANFLPTLVSGEEARLRTMLHDTIHMLRPGVVDFPGSVATLVLPGRATPYTLSDLISDGAVVPWNTPGTYMLIDSVFVSPSTTLDLGGSGLGTLLMNTAPSRFTSIVSWEGTINITGTAADPVRITGWNNGPATDPAFGRPYIRVIGGRLVLAYVRASSLGFWSGATGGVSWTSTSYRPATGGAVSSSFIGNTYGAYVSGSINVEFSDDLFESSQVDGLRLYLNADNSTVTGSAAVRNDGNGFAVSRGSHDVLRGDVALHNAANGFLLDAQPLITGTAASGGEAAPFAGLAVISSESEGNLRAGILVEGGSATVVRDNIVCGSSSAIAVRLGALDAAIVGNDVRCGRKIGVSVGPAVNGTMISGNTVSQSHIGVLIRSSPTTRLLNNHMDTISVFGIAVRGASPGVAGNGNVIAGRGFAPTQATAGASAPLLSHTNLVGWKHRTSPTVLEYLRYHPLLLTWLIILLFVFLFFVLSRLRRRPVRPYQHVVPWQSHSVVITVGGPALEGPTGSAELAGGYSGGGPGSHLYPPDSVPRIAPASARDH